MNKVFLGLGSNIENRYDYISGAVDIIKNNRAINFIQSSSYYETEPWGIKKQNSYINIVIEISTVLSPDELLIFMKDVEFKIGRIAREKWTEREIDIDILFYNDIILKKENLEIPHPEIQNRNFVLIPMNEIAPDFIHPVLEKKISELVSSSPDNLKCNKI